MSSSSWRSCMTELTNLSGVDGLFKIVGGAERGERLVLVLGAPVQPGDDDHRDPPLGLLGDLLGQVEAVDLGQDGLQDDEVGLIGLEFIVGRLSVGGLDDPNLLGFQELGHGFQAPAVVIDDQDFLSLHGTPCQIVF